MPEDSKVIVPTNPALVKPLEFPYSEADKLRLSDYQYFSQLFDGAHFEAFKIRISSEDFNQAYAKIRYLYVNFAGMITKIVADMLFGETLGIQSENADAQEWMENLWKENYMDILCFESALTNSAEGDALFKLRVAPRRPTDKDSTVIIETAPASIYFPHVDGFNVSAEPQIKELAWAVKINKEDYLRREIHEPGAIYNQLWKLKGKKIEDEAPLTLLGIPNLLPVQFTNIDRHLLIHVPNWKTTKRWNGYSDYYDLDSLFFAINNRISRIDNVLDKHTDPILMVPPGVIDEKTGKVKKDNRVIEFKDGENGKPEYIVWDASLENAFKQIEKLVEFIYMIGEVSPDVLGLGTGVSDSGRALKFKLMRTIAKVARKKLYYDKAIKEALYVAQLLAKKNNAKVGGKPVTWEPEMPDLVWKDGLPTDETELIDNEVKKIDAGITSQKDSIMKVHDVDAAAAEKMLKDINKEKQANMPEPLDPKRNPFNKGGAGGAPGGMSNDKGGSGGGKDK